MLAIQRCRRKTGGALTGPHNERIIDVRAVIEHRTPAIRTDVKLGGAGTERFSRHHEAHDHGDG